MPKSLTKEIVLWKGRTIPGKRVIPPHLKLAILSRVQIFLPPGNVQWLLHSEEQRGATWPGRLTTDLSQLFAELPLTIELFVNQRPEMSTEDIDETLHAYTSLRRARHIMPRCHFLPFAWRRHADRQELERRLDLDLAPLYRVPRVTQGEMPRVILLAYVCLPEVITRFLAAEEIVITSVQPPTEMMQALEGMTSKSSERHLRTAQDTESESLGEQDGHAVAVSVINKAESDGFFWYQVILKADLPVKKGGLPKVIKADTKCWIVADGLEYVAVPWSLFRHQLINFEDQNASLSLDGRITKLRQMSHAKNTPFDAVIGTPPGKVYRDTRPFIADSWQLLKDYDAVRAPDGRIVDIHHVIVGLDVLSQPERPVVYNGVYIGANYAAATWAGDLGAGAADMTLAWDKWWERRSPKPTDAERGEHYFMTRASDWDLLADIDVWGIHALRSPEVSTIDELLSGYYEDTTPGGTRLLTTRRKDALELFLRHYGFTYENDRDHPNYPVFPKQDRGRGRAMIAIKQFGTVWLFRRNPLVLFGTARPVSEKIPTAQSVSAMAQQFLYWLEYATIENGAEVLGP